MTARKKLSSVLSLSALALAALLGYAYLLYTVYAMNQESARTRAEIASATENQSNALTVNNFLRATEESRRALGAHFITENSIVAFIERLESLGEEAGIAFSLSAVDPSASGPPALGVSFSVGGTFENLQHFLSLLEALPLELDVERFAMGKAPAALGKAADLWEGQGSVRLLSFIKE